MNQCFGPKTIISKENIMKIRINPKRPIKNSNYIKLERTVTIWSNTNLEAVIGDSESASIGINSEPRPSLIMVEAKSIIAAVSGRVALYSRSLTGA